MGSRNLKPFQNGAEDMLQKDCADEVEMIADIIESCVRPKDGSYEK